MKQAETPFYIVSAMLNTLTATKNNSRHEEVKVWLDSLNIPYKVVKGMYKGTSELAFLIPKTESSQRVISMIVRDYGQECHLFVDGNRYASLVYPNGTEMLLGLFERITDTTEIESYTVDLATNQAWTTRKLG